MPFETVDYLVMAGYLLIMIAAAVAAKWRGQESLDDYFAGGRNLPWWLIGISMVATTFAADTPLAVTGIVASEGIAGNWIWWNFMFSGLFTVFLYAKLWRRADVLTDVEFIEIRYGGKPAEFLRSFRALYLALPINCIILGWVTVGMAKILTVLTGAEQWMIIILLYLMIGVYIAISGLWGVVVTDFIQFIIALGGTILLAVYAVDAVGGLEALQSKLAAEYGQNHHFLDFNPLTSPKIMLSTALVWVSMMWWVSWYPGAEPGGGGYIAQRMFSAKDEKNAVGGTLLFNLAHYALRPWPWILVALVALVMYPGLEDKETGYPMLMLELLPAGLLGLLTVAFLSAFVSTVSTHLNWGTSYVMNDFYRRYYKPPEEFSTKEQAERHYVWVSRWATLLMMGLAILVSYFFETVKGGWEAILSIGAGTGLVFMLRWFWWRINAWSEITAMAVAGIASFLAPQIGYDDFASKMIFTSIVTTASWLSVTLLTPAESHETLKRFYDRVKPGGPGWRQFRPKTERSSDIGIGISEIILSLATVVAIFVGMERGIWPYLLAVLTATACILLFLYRAGTGFWPGIAKVFISAASIIAFLYGMGQVFFGLWWLGILMIMAALGIITVVVHQLVGEEMQAD